MPAENSHTDNGAQGDNHGGGHDHDHDAHGDGHPHLKLPPEKPAPHEVHMPHHRDVSARLADSAKAAGHSPDEFLPKSHGEPGAKHELHMPEHREVSARVASSALASGHDPTQYTATDHTHAKPPRSSRMILALGVFVLLIAAVVVFAYMHFFGGQYSPAFASKMPESASVFGAVSGVPNIVNEGARSTLLNSEGNALASKVLADAATRAKDSTRGAEPASQEQLGEWMRDGLLAGELRNVSIRILAEDLEKLGLDKLMNDAPWSITMVFEFADKATRDKWQTWVKAGQKFMSRDKQKGAVAPAGDTQLVTAIGQATADAAAKDVMDGPASRLDQTPRYKAVAKASRGEGVFLLLDAGVMFNLWNKSVVDQMLPALDRHRDEMGPDGDKELTAALKKFFENVPLNHEDLSLGAWFGAHETRWRVIWDATAARGTRWDADELGLAGSGGKSLIGYLPEFSRLVMKFAPLSATPEEVWKRLCTLWPGLGDLGNAVMKKLKDSELPKEKQALIEDVLSMMKLVTGRFAFGVTSFDENAEGVMAVEFSNLDQARALSEKLAVGIGGKPLKQETLEGMPAYVIENAAVLAFDPSAKVGIVYFSAAQSRKDEKDIQKTGTVREAFSAYWTARKARSFLDSEGMKQATAAECDGDDWGFIAVDIGRIVASSKSFFEGRRDGAPESGTPSASLRHALTGAPPAETSLASMMNKESWLCFSVGRPEAKLAEGRMNLGVSDLIGMGLAAWQKDKMYDAALHDSVDLKLLAAAAGEWRTANPPPAALTDADMNPGWQFGGHSRIIEGPMTGGGWQTTGEIDGFIENTFDSGSAGVLKKLRDRKLLYFSEAPGESLKITLIHPDTRKEQSVTCKSPPAPKDAPKDAPKGS